MKSKNNNKGYAFILLIFFIGIIGLEMVILTGISGSMAFQTDRAYLKACEDNLIASGLSWADINASHDDTFEFDTTALAGRDTELNVKIETDDLGKKQVHVTTSCSRARQTFGSEDVYKL